MTARIVRLGGPGQGSRPADINITPLVDVVLVLLIIFMVVTPLLEKTIGVQLPSTEKAEALPDVVPDQTVVRIGPDGAFTLNDVATRAEDLVPAITARMDRIGKVSERIVFFVSDDAAPYPSLVKALDAARKAGATTLGMAGKTDADPSTARPAP